MPERERIRSYEQLFCSACRPATVRALPPRRPHSARPGEDPTVGPLAGESSRRGTAPASTAERRLLRRGMPWERGRQGAHPRHVTSGGSAVLEPTRGSGSSRLRSAHPVFGQPP
jgi:hypothetical protein